MAYAIGTTLTVCLCLIWLMTTISSVPLQNEFRIPSRISEVDNDENELRTLLKLDINGQKTEAETAQRTVSDVATGELLSNVRQEMVNPDKGDGREDQPVQLKTEVDVPNLGLHESFVQLRPKPTGRLTSQYTLENPFDSSLGPTDPDQSFSDILPDIDVGPAAIARYLLATGDFTKLYTALARLVNASMMTVADAEDYLRAVDEIYERFLMDMEENYEINRFKSARFNGQLLNGNLLTPTSKNDASYPEYNSPDTRYLADEPETASNNPHEALYAIINNLYDHVELISALKNDNNNHPPASYEWLPTYEEEPSVELSRLQNEQERVRSHTMPNFLQPMVDANVDETSNGNVPLEYKRAVHHPKEELPKTSTELSVGMNEGGEGNGVRGARPVMSEKSSDSNEGGKPRKMDEQIVIEKRHDEIVQ